MHCSEEIIQAWNDARSSLFEYTSHEPPFLPPVLNDGQNWQPHNVAVLTAALFIESVSAKIYRT